MTYWRRGVLQTTALVVVVRMGLVGVPIGGAVILLIVAITDHGSGSVPSLVIGGIWLLIGLTGFRPARQAREIVLSGSSVEFRLPARCLTIPSGEILEVSRPRWDLNHMGYVRFRTRSDGVIRVAPRLQGLVEFLVALRTDNPAVKIGANL
jgi:hypothetical protein